MARAALAAIAQTLRGIGVGLRSGKRVVFAVTGAVFVFNLVAPVAILSVARRLPEYLASEEPLAKKLSFLSQMAIAWVSADNKVEGIDWGFIVDVPTLARIILTSLVFGAYFALWSYRRRQGAGLKAARPAGVAGAVTSVFGLTTGPCTLAGCGVPVLPVVGLAFTGLSTATLTMLTMLSRVSFVVILSLMGLAVVWFGWRIGQPAGEGALPSS